jgi:hypothetical protein
MQPLDALFERFLRERQDLQNVADLGSAHTTHSLPLVEATS